MGGRQASTSTDRQRGDSIVGPRASSKVFGASAVSGTPDDGTRASRSVWGLGVRAEDGAPLPLHLLKDAVRP